MEGGLRFEGIQTVEDNLLKRFEFYKRYSKGRARRVAERVEARAQELCPELTGRLKNSSEIYDLDRPEDEAAYGIGFTAPYALPVHYDPHAVHPNGTDRFLEKALFEHSHELVGDLTEGWART